MRTLLNLGQAVNVNADLYPDKPGARDLARSLTYRQWNERSSRLANALLGLGLGKGDRMAILAYNCVEWLEIYVAIAKAGLVAVPVNFRLLGQFPGPGHAVVVADSLADRDNTSGLNPNSVASSLFGADFLSGIDSYRNVERAIKYGVLFHRA